MKTQWTAGLRGDEKENFQVSVRNSKIVLDKLKEILYNMHTGKQKVVTIDYSSPSWSHEQAHRNGYCEALEKVMELLDVSQKPDI